MLPSQLYFKIVEKKLDITSGILQFFDVIQNSNDTEQRIESLHLLKLLDINDDKIYDFVVNLFISDSNTNIRLYSAKFLKEKFAHRLLEPMIWAFKNEKNFDCLINTIKILGSINSADAKESLVDRLNVILDSEYIDRNNRYKAEDFVKSLDNLLKNQPIESLNSTIIADILINYKTIEQMINKFYYVFFKWRQGFIIKLDLSDLGWNVSRSWRTAYANRLGNLDQIPGLLYLKNLQILDLSNNRLENIKLLNKLRNLTHLYLKDNKMDDLKNIEYLKEISNLKYVDLRGNEFARQIDKEVFPNTKIVTRDYLTFQ